jgi:hypothetical protein
MPFLKYQERQILFRESIIGFFVGETDEDKAKQAKTKYCKACMTKNKNKKTPPDCGKCSKKIGGGKLKGAGR